MAGRQFEPLLGAGCDWLLLWSCLIPLSHLLLLHLAPTKWYRDHRQVLLWRARVRAYAAAVGLIAVPVVACFCVCMLWCACMCDVLMGCAYVVLVWYVCVCVSVHAVVVRVYVTRSACLTALRPTSPASCPLALLLFVQPPRILESHPLDNF